VTQTTVPNEAFAAASEATERATQQAREFSKLAQEWVKTTIDAQATLVKAITDAYVKAIRVPLD
jgi:isopropylmalate/homocitrate/citramalate synthase